MTRSEEIELILKSKLKSFSFRAKRISEDSMIDETLPKDWEMLQEDSKEIKSYIDELNNLSNERKNS